MTSSVVIQKKNEVYLKIECEPHVQYELADEFTFEVPQAKFMSAYKKRFWDGKIKLFSPGTGEIYVGLLPYILRFAKNAGTNIRIGTTNFTDFHQKWMNSLHPKGSETS